MKAMMEKAEKLKTEKLKSESEFQRFSILAFQFFSPDFRAENKTQ
jgi:hypothetical protein